MIDSPGQPIGTQFHPHNVRSGNKKEPTTRIEAAAAERGKDRSRGGFVERVTALTGSPPEV
jgi:hypothetical protein